LRILISFLFSLFCSGFAQSQSINDSINKNNSAALLSYLASDQLKGRVNFTKEQLKAAEFISQQFSNYRLAPFPGHNSYYFAFSPYSSNAGAKEKLVWNGRRVPDSSFVFINRSLSHRPMGKEDFRVISSELPLPDSLLYHYWHDSLSTLIHVNLPTNSNLPDFIKNIQLPQGLPASAILIVASPEKPVALKLSEKDNFKNSVLYNVVTTLPGRTKPDEAIIFSAHYDHVDTDVSGRRGGVFNGANDNASGTTAVLMLARYFSMKKDNERTLIFCLFAGEELGMLGSKAFAGEIIPGSIKAVINIEMIGVPGSIGKNSFFITGADHSDLSIILKKNLSAGKVSIKNDPSPYQLLFERSDNYPFALQGIPSHSIMCSNDSYPCYHQTCDDVSNIDIENMTAIIQAIAKSCRTLISGEDTPARIK